MLVRDGEGSNRAERIVLRVCSGRSGRVEAGGRGVGGRSILVVVLLFGRLVV